MRGAIPPLLQYVFMAWYFVKHRISLPLLTRFDRRTDFLAGFTRVYPKVSGLAA
jgi:hypothetical protein